MQHYKTNMDVLTFLFSVAAPQLLMRLNNEPPNTDSFVPPSQLLQNIGFENGEIVVSGNEYQGIDMPMLFGLFGTQASSRPCEVQSDADFSAKFLQLQLQQALSSAAAAIHQTCPPPVGANGGSPCHVQQYRSGLGLHF